MVMRSKAGARARVWEGLKGAPPPHTHTHLKRFGQCSMNDPPNNWRREVKASLSAASLTPPRSSVHREGEEEGVRRKGCLRCGRRRSGGVSCSPTLPLFVAESDAKNASLAMSIRQAGRGRERERESRVSATKSGWRGLTDAAEHRRKRLERFRPRVLGRRKNLGCLLGAHHLLNLCAGLRRQNRGTGGKPGG